MRELRGFCSPSAPPSVCSSSGRINSHGLVFFHGVTVFLLTVIVVGLLSAARRHRAGARAVLGAGVAVIVIRDILFYWGVLGARGLVPVSVLGMVGAYSYVLSKKAFG